MSDMRCLYSCGQSAPCICAVTVSGKLPVMTNSVRVFGGAVVGLTEVTL